MQENTEHKILEAAREIFIQKGFAAARMQEIADTAGINKGLLHYYFKSKNKLFLAVFEEAFGKFAIKANRILESDLPLFEKIEHFVNTYLDLLEGNPHLPGFVINELNRNPEEFVEHMLSRKDKPNPLLFLGQIQMEIQKGTIRPVNPFHLVLNMISLSVFPFIGRPMIQGLFGLSPETFQQLMKDRRKEIVDFVIHSIRIGAGTTEE